MIKRAQCGDLSAYLRSDKTAPTLDQVIAVHILSHEARHMAGQTSEGVAECGAVQRDAQTAELLGADPDQALRLAQTYWREVYPRLSEDYLSPRLPSRRAAGRGPAGRALVRLSRDRPDRGTGAEGPGRSGR